MNIVVLSQLHIIKSEPRVLTRRRSSNLLEIFLGKVLTSALSSTKGKMMCGLEEISSKNHHSGGFCFSKGGEDE